MQSTDWTTGSYLLWHFNSVIWGPVVWKVNSSHINHHFTLSLAEGRCAQSPSSLQLWLYLVVFTLSSGEIYSQSHSFKHTIVRPSAVIFPTRARVNCDTSIRRQHIQCHHDLTQTLSAHIGPNQNRAYPQLSMAVEGAHGATLHCTGLLDTDDVFGESLCLQVCSHWWADTIDHTDDLG